MGRRKSTSGPTQPAISTMTQENGTSKPVATAPIPPKKSAREVELDRLVWGDEDGFRAAVASYEDSGQPGELMDLGQDGEANEQDLGGLDDSELFFLDTAPDSAVKGVVPALGLKDTSESESDVPAWVDSDDERLTVSLATSNRLRKLRRYEGEDVVNGVEYTRRLRQQYERLYPAPRWAQTMKDATKAPHSHRQKRRRLSEDGASISDSDSQSSSDSNAESEAPLKTAPILQLLQSNAPLVSAASKSSTGRIRFRPESLDIQRTKDVKSKSPSTINNLAFHPHHPVLLSAGSSGLISLHHISPHTRHPNPELTTVALPRLAISTAAFHPSGNRIIISGRRRFFHVWDMESGSVTRIPRVQGGDPADQKSFESFKISPCGRYVAFVGSGRKGGGTVNVLDANTMHWRCAARVEGKGGVADFAWWCDGQGLVALGKGGEVLEYSVAEKRPVGRWVDEAAVGSTVVALGGRVGGGGAGSSSSGGGGGRAGDGSGDSSEGTAIGTAIGNGLNNFRPASAISPDRWIAIGSASGIVSVYDRSGWKEGTVPAHPAACKTFAQLTTATTQLVFSPDGQLLVFASLWKRDALRIAHVGSGRVVAGWPTSGTPLGRVSAVAVAEAEPNGRLVVAVGNEQGAVRMWDVRG